MPLASILRRKSSEKMLENESKSSPSSPSRPPTLNVSSHAHHDEQDDARMKLEGLSISNAQTIEHTSKEPLISVDDIKTVFSGAPHFTLESTPDGKSHPQAFFPWSLRMETADLVDRKLIRHESFAFATLHPHLPIKGTLGENSSPIEPLHSSQVGKRPEFDIGTFEVPNMLDYEGREPGTSGMRHFLEIPISDSLRTESQVKQAAIATRAYYVEKLINSGFQKALQSGTTMMNVGKKAGWQDRVNIIHGDRKSWRDLGLRNISISVIKSRIAVLGPWYDEMANEGWKGTILDRLNAETLFDELFTLMLHPSSTVKQSSDHGLGVQIEALVNVLATPGAWFDFSLVEWRLRLGQLLWEVPLNEKATSGFDPGAQRHWLLIQILLSVELAIRLDAALRCGKFHLSETVMIPELKTFHNLRTEKVDWDIILARSFLDHVYVEDYPSTLPLTRPPLEQRRISGLFSKWKQRIDNHELGQPGSAWDCLILPRHADVQVAGLLRFAKTIHWPNMEVFEHRMVAKEQRYASATTLAAKQTFVHPLECPEARSPSAVLNQRVFQLPKEKKENKKVGLPASLEPASELESGGWLSRSWFAGLIMPGESISHFLISALLENDQDCITKIGSQADLYGGFTLNGQSWWSKVCIVGKVLAAGDDGAECMGWIHTPSIEPVDELRRPLSNGWLTITTKKMLSKSEKPRLSSGVAIAEDSSPLGSGKGRPAIKDFNIPTDESGDQQQAEVEFENLILQNQKPEDNLTASITFSVKKTSLDTASEIKCNLIHNVEFVSAHACRVPTDQVDLLSDETKKIMGLQAGEPMPGHPLHKFFHYKTKPVSEILDWAAPVPTKSRKQESEVWVIDARGASSQQVLARAWCSKTGQHAIVSRVGRTCLSCSIREAKALDIVIVIRIGHRV